MTKLLIIRFSSFGDIVQAMGVPSAFKREFPDAQIRWLVRSDFANLLSSHPKIDQVLSFDRKLGLIGLVKLSFHLASDRYSHLYDAHNNVRSTIVRSLITLFSIARFHRPPKILVRSKNRFKRWLLFKCRKNLLPNPFRSVESFQKPLQKWLRTTSVTAPQFFVEPAAQQKIYEFGLPKKFLTLVPSAAWEMKRWPLDHWKDLILTLNTENFVILGGPDDSFCDDLRTIAPDRVTNLAGKLSLQESCAVIEKSDVVISNDTGLLHVADQLGVKVIALIGPTAFGYPYHSNARVAEITLWCKPCSKDGRGKCVNEIYKRCLVDLSVKQVASETRKLLTNA